MPFERDLVVLTADKNGEMAMRGVLSRPSRLSIRPLTADYYVHPERDPGCLRTAAELLRFATRTHAYAVVLFDREGCGREMHDRSELERQVEEQLARTGWQERCAAVVVDPELDAWVWSDSPHVDEVLGWASRTPSLRAWLRQRGFLAEPEAKPSRPKEALELALRTVSKPRSSALYQMLAQRVSLQRCTDPAFEKLRRVVTSWFPAE
jgi:hypothetical protein